MPDVFANLKAELDYDPPRISRGAFANRAYGGAKDRAISMGYSEFGAGEFATANFAEASRMWLNRLKYVSVG